jgi:integrase
MRERERERSYVYRDDGTYCIRISPLRQKRRNLRWQVDAYYRGHKAKTRVGGTFSGDDGRELAEDLADALWDDYLAGAHRAPEAAPRTVADAVSRFGERKTGRRGRVLSPATARAYHSQLQAFIAAAGEALPLQHLSQRHVEAALATPRRPRTVAEREGGRKVPRADRSRFQMFVAIRALVRWCVGKGYMGTDITIGLEVDPGPRRMRPFLQPEEWPSFLQGCQPAHMIRAGLILETGLRVNEAVHLRESWLVPGLRGTTLEIPAQDPATGFKAKGREARPIPLTRAALQWLELARARWGRKNPLGFVLHDRPAPPLTSNWCRETKRGCRRGGVTIVDTHGLRRSFGVRFLAAGGDIYDLSRLLGHQSVTTTEQAYAGLNIGRLVAAMRAVEEASTVPRLGAVRAKKASEDKGAARKR